MIFSEEQIKNIKSYIDNEKFKKLCIQLNICSENDTHQELLNKIKEYIENIMMGKYRGQAATIKFLESIEIYLKNSEFERNEQGYINYKLVLPIANSTQREGVRVEGDILGHDGKQYIVKQAEGLKGAISELKNSKEAKYNPTIAYAFFKLLDQPCARNLMAYETFPYYYIFSENFLKENQKAYGLDNEKFMYSEFLINEDNNITHKQIMDGIEKTINKKELTSDKKISLIKKVKLQYAVQETLKSMICCMDQNLGNTSIVITEGENGQIEDINISPAYDLDLSFNLGEEMLSGIPQNQVLYRTTQDGKTDLISIINEFKEIEGYKETLEEIKNKLNGNYIEQIFNIAYEESKVDMFNNKELRDRFGNFIMRKVATFKEACKWNVELKNKSKSK